MNETDSALMYFLIGFVLAGLISRLFKNRPPRMRRVFPRKPMATPWEDPRDVTGKFKQIRWEPTSRNYRNTH